jgi:Big-like domain-containing protein/parallel beta helix pectate lyase-like protein
VRSVSWPRLQRRGRYALLAVIAVVAALAVALPRDSSATELTATPATLGAVFAAAHGGEVIHLKSGDYDSFEPSTQPTSMVTLVADPGVKVTMSPWLQDDAFIRLKGLTITQTYLVRSHHIEFVGNRFTGSARIDTIANSDQHIIFDHNSHDDIMVCPNCHEGRITVVGDDNTGPNGVKIMNSHFSGGNADGVLVDGKAYGTQIGPGNVFEDIVQIDATHTDPIQLYGSHHTLITGNFLYGNETGVMIPDGADHETIVNNVITTSGYPWGVVLGSDDGSVIRHNTMPSGRCKWALRCGALRIDEGNKGVASRDTVVTDNILGNLAVSGGSTPRLEDYNVIATGGDGPSDIRGKPTFAGGLLPLSWGGFRLGARSRGKRAASDGKDMGVITSEPRLKGGGGPPVALLLRPARGASLRSRLKVLARAWDNSGIKKLVLWIDGAKAGGDRSRPYAWKRRAGRRLRYGRHTVSVRAVAKDGQVSSVAVTVNRRRARRKARAGWYVAAAPAGGGTRVAGKGPPRRRVTVTLARCGDRRARTAVRLRLRSSASGRIHEFQRGRSLCVLRLR